MRQEQQQAQTPNKTEKDKQCVGQKVELTHVRRHYLPNFSQDLQSTPTNNYGQRKKAIVLYGPNRSKHLFPFYKDEEVGFVGEYQNIIHPSFNDDDRMTTTTQLELAISQTHNDLMEALQMRNPVQKFSQ